MIYSIFGKITYIFSNEIVLENNNISYFIIISNIEKFSLGEEVNIYISHFIKDEKIYFYGFRKVDELEMFEKLILVDSIGPKTAMNILKNIDVNELIYLISNEKIEDLKYISGVGNKAEKIILELKNKIKKANKEYIFKYENVYKALRNIGYKQTTIAYVLNQIPNDLDDNSALKFAIKEARNYEH